MKHLILFEAWTSPEKEKEKAEKKKENDELFQQLIDENPLSKDHDFYFFIGGDEFKENKDGSYRKTLDIENMVRITPETYTYVNMMEMRARFQQDKKLYHIWLPVLLREEVEGKGSRSMDEWLIEIIDKYKMRGGTDYGKQVYRDILKTRERAKKRLLD